MFRASPLDATLRWFGPQMTRNIKEFVNQARSIRTDSYSGNVGKDHVCILLGLFNGAGRLAEQLESLAAQSHKDWSLIISDDGSQDEWFDIVEGFAARHAAGRTWITQGPAKGFAANFLNLACLAGPMVPFAAFCDQDDVWLPHKIARALSHLHSVPNGMPAVYVSRTMICNQDLKEKRPSLLYQKPPSFENALVQSIGGGNTMVLNRAALDILQDTAPRAAGIVAHDWWVYQLISGVGGRVIYDKTPTLLYRQHESNMIGANDTWRAQILRVRRLIEGQFQNWNDANLAALNRVRAWLTQDAVATLDHFQIARSGRLYSRLAALYRSGVTRQRRRGTLALLLAAVLNRL